MDVWRARSFVLVFSPSLSLCEKDAKAGGWRIIQGSSPLVFSVSGSVKIWDGGGVEETRHFSGLDQTSRTFFQPSSCPGEYLSPTVGAPICPLHPSLLEELGRPRWGSPSSCASSLALATWESDVDDDDDDFPRVSALGTLALASRGPRPTRFFLLSLSSPLLGVGSGRLRDASAKNSEALNKAWRARSPSLEWSLSPISSGVIT